MLRPTLRLSALTLVAALGLTLSFTAKAAEVRYTAKVFEIEDRNKEHVLYNYRSESEMVGYEMVVKNQFTYPDGRVASHEEIHFRMDKTVSLYRQHQEQLKADGTIEIASGKATFTWTKDGKTKVETEAAPPEFIIGSQIPLEIEANWDKLQKGEKFKRRLAVLERQESVGFEFSKEADAELGGKKVVIIKMKPSAFLIAAVVSPIHFYMTPDGSTLIEIHGRTTVKKDVGGKFKDLDAIITYEKGAAAVVPAAQAPKSGGNSK